MRVSQVLRKHLLRTILNPVNHTLEKSLESLQFTPKSLLCLVNSRNVEGRTHDIVQFSKKYPSMSLFLGAVDSPHQDYTSEIWLGSPFRAHDAIPLPDSTEDKFQEYKTRLTFRFNNDSISLPLIRTDPFVDAPHILCYKEPDCSFSPILSHLSVSIPLLPHKTNTFTALSPIHEGWFKITSHLDNIVKEISDQPASSLLLGSLRDSGLGRSQGSVFFELKNGDVLLNKYQIIAGGGEYGAKSDMLVLDCESLPESGSLEGRFLAVLDDVGINDVDNGFVVEEINDEKRIVTQGQEDLIIDGNIRVGSEKGFRLNGVNYNAANDIVQVEV